MSEFQDFLTHKFAHVTIGEFQPGKFAEAQQLYQEAIATYHEEGFRGAYLLQEKGTERGISVIFWDSEDSMAANENEAYKAILRKMAPLFASTPVTTAYEVVSEIQPPPAS